MENFWTTNKPIHGLRHFVLINEITEKGKSIFLMVSVVDCQINVKISSNELFTSGNWNKGWLNLPHNESITKDYLKYKSLNRKEEISEVFITDDSIFYIV